MIENLIGKSAFARLAGVHPSTITSACKNGLGNATVGKRINLAHPKVIEYLKDHDVDYVAPPPKPPSTKKTLKTVQLPEDIIEVMGWTLTEIIETYGNKANFNDLLKATQTIEIVNEKRLKNAKTKEDLITRELVKVGIIEPLETMLRKLLTDGAKTLSIRIPAMHIAGRTPEEIEVDIQRRISSFIKPMKKRMKRVITDVSN